MPSLTALVRSQAPVSALVVSLAAASAEATTINYEVSIAPAQSTIESTTSISAPVTGTFIGNWDAVSNPTGTKTIPGLFGGGGNNPLGYSATFAATGDTSSSPTGGFGMSVDVDSLAFAIGNLDIDLLGGSAVGIAATATLTYPNFHTENPSAIFIGLTLPLPLGEISIESLVATQTGGPVAGLLVPAGRSLYAFAAAVPVDLHAVLVVNGQEIVTDPVPFAMPVAGTIDFGGRSVTVTLDAATELDETTPLDPAPEFSGQPVDLPTVLPPGGVAHLLFSGAISSVSVAAALDLSIFADAVPQLDPADLNGDGVVGAQDLGILLGAWGTSGPGDLNGDDLVNAADLAILLGAWT